MAFGFPASFSGRVELNVFRQTAREAVGYVLDLLDWHFEMIDNDTFHAKIPASGSSWGERLTVSLAEPGVLEIQSLCWPLPQIFDWGKNKRNVTQFVAIFEPKVVREAKLPKEEPNYFDLDGKSPVERALKDGEFPRELQKAASIDGPFLVYIVCRPLS